MSVPGGDHVVPLGELGVGRDHAELLLPREGALPLDVPAVVELAGVPVRPLLGDVVRGVGGPRCPVDEERLVRHQRLLLVDPGDGAVGEVFGQVVALLRGGGRLDRGRAVVERRVVLVVLATDEAVEVLEAATARGPGVERAQLGGLPHRHLVALAELRRRVAVQLQGHRHRCLGVRPQRGVARGRRGRLGDAAHSHGVVVAAGEQGLSSGGAQRGGVEPVVAQATCRQPIRRRRPHRAAERAGRAEAHVVDEDDQDVGGTGRRGQRLDGRVRRVRVLGVVRRQTVCGMVGDRQHGS